MDNLKRLTSADGHLAKDWQEHPLTRLLIKDLKEELTKSKNRLMQVARESDDPKLRKAIGEYDSIKKLLLSVKPGEKIV